MPSKTLQFASIFLVSGMLALAGCSSTATSTSGGVSARTADPVKTARTAERFDEAEARASATRTGEVYLLRGLADVFSRGMDVMGAKLNRSGVYAMVDSYANWQEIADIIVKRSKKGDLSYPIVIMGHSLGGNDAHKMASYLGQRGIKVSYVVTFDPTRPGYVGKNVDRVVNFYLPNDEGNTVRKAAGFTGSLQNISMAGHDDITHTTIEKNVKLQNDVIGRIMSMTKKKR